MIGTNNLNQRKNLVLPQTVQLKSTLKVGSQDAVNKNTGEAKTSAVYVGEWSEDKSTVVIDAWKAPIPGDKVIINGVAYKISEVKPSEYEDIYNVTVSEECLIVSGDFDPDRGWYPC